MHILQPLHKKLNEKDSQIFLDKFEISREQLPRILLSDPALPEGSSVGDIIKIEREESSFFLNKNKKDNSKKIYYRVVISNK